MAVPLPTAKHQITISCRPRQNVRVMPTKTTLNQTVATQWQAHYEICFIDKTLTPILIPYSSSILCKNYGINYYIIRELFSVYKINVIVRN